MKEESHKSALPSTGPDGVPVAYTPSGLASPVSPAFCGLRAYQEAPIGLCYLDADLRYVHINDWLAAINGLTAEEHLGRTLAEVLPEIAKGVESQFRHVIETGEPLAGQVYAETPARPGVKRHYAHHYYPDKSEDGTVVGISCAVEDVTERVWAEEALRRSEERLRALGVRLVEVPSSAW